MNIQISSYARGKRFVAVLTDETFLSIPRWQVQDDFPPLSPRAALQVADELFDSFIPYRNSWELQSIDLRHILDDIWIYMVTYGERRLGSGPPTEFKAVVLLDGTPVRPMVLDASDSRMIV